MARLVAISVRLPAETVAKLKELAEVEGRSQTNMIQRLIDQAHREQTKT